MRHLGNGEQGDPRHGDASEAGSDTLPRLAVLGRLTATILAALGTLAVACAGIALLAQVSGLMRGAELNALILAASGLVCGALAAVAAGIARAAVRASETAVPPGAVLVTCHGPRGDVRSVDARGGPFAAGAGEALLGQALFERVLVADRPAFLSAIQAAAHGRVLTLMLRLRCDAGGDAAPAFMALDARCQPLRAGGVRVVWAAPWQAADAERLKADAAARARAEAEAANAAKSRFLAAMSHELRTPLNAILGFSEMLSDPAGIGLDDARRQEYARIIHDSGQHLLGVVNDILDLSRVEAGAYALERESVDMAALVAGCVEMVAIDAARAGITIRTSAANGLPAVEADRRAMRQIVLNLLSNAVKFTPAGGRVQVGVRVQGDEVTVRVRDSGPGMRAEDVARLGEPFFQAGDCTQKGRGSGLGLAVVKGLVKLHGGELQVHSAPGRGTSVIVALPLAAADGVSAGPVRTDVVVAAFPARPDGARTRKLA